MRLWAVAIHYESHTQWFMYATHVVAENKSEARKQAMEIALENNPISFGYYGHNVSVYEIICKPDVNWSDEQICKQS